MFIFLIANELLFSLSCRNLKRPVLNKEIFSNKRLSIGLGVLLIIQIIVLTTGISHFFIVDNLTLNSVLITLGVCLMLFILGELAKPIYAKMFRDYSEVKK